MEGGYEGLALVVAAGHVAVHHRTVAGMIALHGGFGRCGRVSVVFVIRFGVAMSGAHAAGAAIHAICLKCGRPKRGP